MLTASIWVLLPSSRSVSVRTGSGEKSPSRTSLGFGISAPVYSSAISHHHEVGLADKVFVLARPRGQCAARMLEPHLTR